MIDITYTQEEWENLKESLSSESFSVVNRYSYKENNLYILCTDNAQFMNHSVQKVNVANTDDLKSMFATRSIKKGEELLCNYFEYSDKDDFHVKKLKD